jgi:hypothetical protein
MTSLSPPADDQRSDLGLHRIAHNLTEWYDEQNNAGDQSFKPITIACLDNGGLSGAARVFGGLTQREGPGDSHPTCTHCTCENAGGRRTVLADR